MLCFLSCCFENYVLRLSVLSEIIISILTPQATNNKETPMHCQTLWVHNGIFWLYWRFQGVCCLTTYIFFMSLKNQLSLQTLRTAFQKSAIKIYTVCEILISMWLLSACEIPSCKIQLVNLGSAQVRSFGLALGHIFCPFIFFRLI